MKVFASLVGKQRGITRADLRAVPDNGATTGLKCFWPCYPLFCVFGLNGPDWQSTVARTRATLKCAFFAVLAVLSAEVPETAARSRSENRLFRRKRHTKIAKIADRASSGVGGAFCLQLMPLAVCTPAVSCIEQSILASDLSHESQTWWGPYVVAAKLLFNGQVGLGILWRLGLSGPYCAIPRDYLSNTPIARYGEHDQFGEIPRPPFLSLSPLESMRSGGAIPPTEKGYLSDACAIPHEKRLNGCDAPSGIRSRKGIARYGGCLALGH